MGKSKKSSVRLPSDDAMTDDLREAIRAKHRLVEQMKEDVKDGDRDGKGDGSGEPKRSPVWKIVVIVGIVVLFFTMVSGASAAENSAPLLGTERDTEETGTTLFVPGTVRSDDADSHREIIIETRPRLFVLTTRGANRALVEAVANMAVREG